MCANVCSFVHALYSSFWWQVQTSPFTRADEMDTKVHYVYKSVDSHLKERKTNQYHIFSHAFQQVEPYLTWRHILYISVATPYSLLTSSASVLLHRHWSTGRWEARQQLHNTWNKNTKSLLHNVFNKYFLNHADCTVPNG